ncbi:MAG: HAD family hydrolase [Alphaproteobacteria bacterium]|jgi:phosphoglycolate phosphatase|nr:HAD family hydrolase [Alphaproteobacteria bacterium]
MQSTVPVQHDKLPAPTAFLFDWDNTLVDTFELIFKSMNAALKSVDKPEWTWDEAHKMIHRSARDSFKDFFGDRWPQAQKVYYQSFEQYHLETLKPLGEAESLIKAIAAKNIPMGLVSNKQGKYLRLEVEHIGWGHYFQAVVGATDAPKDKPHADPALMALKTMGLEASRSVYFVGDTVTDLGCAYNAGLTAVFQRDPLPAPTDFSDTPPHLSAKNCADLKELLTQLCFI